MEIKQGTIEELVGVNAQIKEFATPYGIDVFRERLADRQWLGLIASEDGVPLAFKLGYAESASEFYSWLGGVLPNARRRGLARQLLHAQEAWVIDHGYTTLRVKSRNRYRNMLQLLLAEGYHITGFEQADESEDHRIWFTKSL